MEIEKIKQKMIEFKDFFGGHLLEVDLIKESNTKEELISIIDNHSTHLEMQLNDALSHLSRFKERIGLGMFSECPECLRKVDSDELDMFGGLCEDCTNG